MTKRAREIKRWVSCGVYITFFVFLFLDPFWSLEYRAQDFAFQRPGLTHPDIVVVGIDERTLFELGPFHQWSRTGIAQAIEILNRYEDARPAVIAVDVLFTETGLDAHADAALVDAVAGADNIVLASLLEFGLDHDGLTLGVMPVNHQRPFPDLLPHVRYGMINGIFDRDGFVRHAFLRQEFEGEQVFSLPVEVAMMFTGNTPDEFVMQNYTTYIRYTGLPGIPVGDFFQLSFSDIFQADFDPAFWADTIIMIGPYTTGMMDHYPVPIDHEIAMYGVEILANIVQVILDGAYKVDAPEHLAFAVVLLAIALATLLSTKLDIRIAFLAIAATGVGYFFLARLIFSLGYLLPVLAPIVALGAVFLYQLVYEYLLGVMEKGRLRATLGKYVDPKLVNLLIESGEADSNEVGQKKHVAVLFVDVRGFTPMTEKLRETPEQVVEILNEYLELTSSAVFSNGGSVDKFIGDATMALFNGFVPLEDYVYKAVKAAWDMVEGAQTVNDSIKKRLGVEIGFGVGVHCGEAIVGNLGPSFRKDYTAIGDVVNTAARLESNAKKSQILISTDVYDLLKDRIMVESVGEIALKGKSLPMQLFALTGVLT